MKTSLFHPEAEEEMIVAARFYEKRAEGLGISFLHEVETGIHRIGEAPERYPIFAHNIRRYLLHRFPFSILYSKRKDALVIIAVMHHNQRPYYWKIRV